MKCKHNYHFCGCITNFSSIYFRCTKCRKEFSRKPTKEEVKILKECGYGLDFRKTLTIHKVWFDFHKTFIQEEADGYPLTQRKWKYIGYELMKRVRKWVKKYPNDVKLTDCDDDYYSSSMLVLIEHKTEDDYHGTTVVYIPQCTGESPMNFFLYPCDRASLIEDLQTIRKESRVIEASERKKDWERSKRIRESIKPRIREFKDKINWNEEEKEK